MCCTCALLIVTLISRRQSKIALNLERDLYQLHSRRLARVREALAASVNNDWTMPAEPSFPFECWVQFSAEGVTVAGKSFRAEEKFQVTAKDERNIHRATVTGDGQGTVVITSFGQTFRAMYRDQGWTVEQLTTPTNEPRKIS